MKIEARSFLHPTALVQAGGRRLAPADQVRGSAKISEQEGETRQASPLRKEVFDGLEFEGVEAETATYYRNEGKKAEHLSGDLLLAMIAQMGGAGPLPEKGSHVDLRV